jgi:hypothetical protein
MRCPCTCNKDFNPQPKARSWYRFIDSGGRNSLVGRRSCVLSPCSRVLRIGPCAKAEIQTHIYRSQTSALYSLQIFMQQFFRSPRHFSSNTYVEEMRKTKQHSRQGRLFEISFITDSMIMNLQLALERLDAL